MLEQPEIFSIGSELQVTKVRSAGDWACAKYLQSINQRGFNQLHIFANPAAGLLQQHKGAGFLEGYLTYQQIYSAYRNLKQALIKSESLSEGCLTFMREQLHYAEQQIRLNPSDIFWQYAEAYVAQLQFMHKGYLTRITQEQQPHLFLHFEQFYLLTSVGDLADLIPGFHDPTQMQAHIQGNPLGNCNGYVTVLEGEVCVAHSTHNIYEFMLRIVKSYRFPTQDPRVGSSWFSFTSRPGDLRSKDDFYVHSSGLVVIETSLSNQNPQNYKDLHSKSLPSWLRVCIAANLAKHCTDWQQLFLRESSGTHNNQWLIVDTKKVGSSSDFILCVEEGFCQSSVMDMSGALKQRGYIASYNIPCSSKIYQKLHYHKYPFTYENEPRAIEYRRYHQKIRSVADMKKWFLTNQGNMKQGLAPRYDLSSIAPNPFGLTDCKIVTSNSLNTPCFEIVSGPSTSGGKLPAFRWTSWPAHSREGMPEEWEFGWQTFTIEQPPGPY